MSNEIQLPIPSLPTTAYAILRETISTGRYRNIGVEGSGSGVAGWEAYTASNWSNYAIPLARDGSSMEYAGNMPTGIVAGVYSVRVYVQAGASPSPTADTLAGSGVIAWNGVGVFQPPTAFGQEVGTATAGASTAITLASTASSVNDYYANMTIVIISGTGALQTRRITAYNGTTKVATVSSAWATNPASGSVYTILGRIE